jgi:twitching motility protein PilT
MNALRLSNLLKIAADKKASDLHLCAGDVPLLRMDGELIPLDSNQQYDEWATMLLAILSPSQQFKLNQGEELDFTYTTDDQLRTRVNVYRQQRGLSAAFRLISEKMPTIESLKLPSVLEKLCLERHGLILITGPTGSGKSTSLAACIHQINITQAKHIITIEDPIEFIHVREKSLITQREVQRDTLTFQHALRSALRQDPDIMAIAELRDLETIRLALTAAETGHLVLATLHTASAVKSIDRIVDVFPGNEKDMIRALLSESLLAIISQRLCQKPTGGRHAQFEILRATPAIKHLIRENKPAQIYSAMQTGKSQGMCTF